MGIISPSCWENKQRGSMMEWWHPRSASSDGSQCLWLLGLFLFNQHFIFVHMFLWGFAHSLPFLIDSLMKPEEAQMLSDFPKRFTDAALSPLVQPWCIWRENTDVMNQKKPLVKTGKRHLRTNRWNKRQYGQHHPKRAALNRRKEAGPDRRQVGLNYTQVFRMNMEHGDA